MGKEIEYNEKREHKTFKEFIMTWQTYGICLFQGLFFGLGVWALFYDSTALGVVFMLFFGSILIYYFTKRYKKWKELYGEGKK